MINTRNFPDLVIAEIHMSQVEQLFKSSHRRQLHMGETDTLNAELPIDTIQGLTLHYLAILTQHLITDTTCSPLLTL